MQEDNIIEKNLSLRELYNKYLHPKKLPIENQKIWSKLHNNEILSLFQFDSPVGAQAAKMIKPTDMNELANANSLMRLMAQEKGAETPMGKYVRFKNDISQWYTEMKHYGLTQEEINTLEPHFLSSYGVPPTQEHMMKMLMDESICGFTLGDANSSRKIIGKKIMSKIPELKEKILTSAKSERLGRYVWDCGIGPQVGYSFSNLHSLAYAFIGFQTMFLATHFNPIYWNTACLIVNSGALDATETDEETKEKSTDYGKVAKAIGEIKARGIDVSLVDINNSSYGFKPDTDNNQILYGLKGLNGVGAASIEKIVAGRPYSNIADFMQRCPLDKRTMFSLLKAGAFDNLGTDWNIDKPIRLVNMVYYVSQVYEKKKRITLQNVAGLISNELLPEELDQQKRVFEFNKYLKTMCKKDKYYLFDERANEFYENNFDTDLLAVINGEISILQTEWEKIYKKQMEVIKKWIAAQHDTILKDFNALLFNEMWNKYALGTISSYEMDSLGFYYGDHELINVDLEKYGIVNFEEMDEESSIAHRIKRGNAEIPIFNIDKIIGTVIGKDDTKSTVTLLTTGGVVGVKFSREHFSMYKRQLSETQEDGSKKVTEKGWFKRGTKLMVCGYRRGDQFVIKTYKNTGFHSIYKITEVKENGSIEIIHDREGQSEEG